MLDLHLNLFGGLTGDMFIAAVLDAFPRFEARVMAAIDALDGPYPVVCSLVAHSGHEMAGHRFEIEPFDKYFGRIPLAFPQEPSSWDSVRGRLVGADIGPGVRTHATKIFELLMRAEAALQGIAPERVALETGAWNSIAQVVGAASLIDALDRARWSASAFPEGGVVTLTGAAIVDYLCPPRSRRRPQPKARSLVRSGTGFGLVGSQNDYMRLLCFEAGDAGFLAQEIVPVPARADGGADQLTRQ
ncbi:MAG TPA: nickel insertion protein [Steroidobacteraceae bacterium]|nr:nickel insertion protein [Steroidobacteraceae bacterium]